MADVTIKRIDQLPEAASPQGSDLLPLWQGTQTTKVKLESIQASGPAGKDGVSPTVEVSKSGTQTTITITDAQGKHTSTINDGAAGAPGKDGAKGDPGDPGEDGFSPTVDVKKVGKTTTVTITDKQGAHVATIEDGADGEGGGGSAYTLPVASAETLGGVKAKAKTDAETVEVAVDPEGKLYVPAASSGGGDSYTLPVASANAIGGVKGPAKTNAETEQVHIDDEGKMWVKPSGGGGSSEALTMTLNVEIKGGTSAAVTVTAQSIHRMLRVGDVIDTTLTITQNEYVINNHAILFDRAIGQVCGITDEESGQKNAVIVFRPFAATPKELRFADDITAFSVEQNTQDFTLGDPTKSLAKAFLLAPKEIYVYVVGETLPSDNVVVDMRYNTHGNWMTGNGGIRFFTKPDGTEIVSTIDTVDMLLPANVGNSLSPLCLPFVDDFAMRYGDALITASKGRLRSSVFAGGGGASGGNGVSLYVVNQTVGNVDFSRYKAGDVVLLVQDLVVTKEV